MTSFEIFTQIVITIICTYVYLIHKEIQLLSNRIDKLEKTVKIHTEDLKQVNDILIRFNEWFKKVFRDNKKQNSLKSELKHEIKKQVQYNEHKQ